ncbi:MAG: FHA domain-containing protein, partial [Cutibacterium granulosum]|nr:FHA domain-containing protein [Cutibacterium granulosum]
ASTEHAEISQGFDGLWFVEDLTSTNGTYVNGQNIEELTRLDVDDEVRIGRTVMVVRGQR